MAKKRILRRDTEKILRKMWGQERDLLKDRQKMGREGGRERGEIRQREGNPRGREQGKPGTEGTEIREERGGRNWVQGWERERV